VQIALHGSTDNLGLSKARRDRDRPHDRCHRPWGGRLAARTYHHVTQGTFTPNTWHNSTAAAYRVTPRTADHSAKAWPRDPQEKHWYRPKATFTENERLRGFREQCTGQGPRHWSPCRTIASNCNCCRTSL